MHHVWYRSVWAPRRRKGRSRSYWETEVSSRGVFDADWELARQARPNGCPSDIPLDSTCIVHEGMRHMLFIAQAHNLEKVITRNDASGGWLADDDRNGVHDAIDQVHTMAYLGGGSMPVSRNGS